MINKVLSTTACTAIAVVSAMVMAQAPPGGAKGGGGKGGGGRGPAGPVLTVTSNAWPDGSEVPMHFAGRGDNKSPAFEFHWMMGTMPAMPPDTLKTYAVIFHDIENVGAGKTTSDTLHWSAFNIPGTATGLPEGLGAGVLLMGRRTAPALLLAAEPLEPTSVLARDLVHSITTCSSSTLWTPSWICRPPPLARIW